MDKFKLIFKSLYYLITRMVVFTKINKKIFKIIFMFLLILGCFWQTIYVCDLYFKYPTNIFIETNFQPLTTVPALTFMRTAQHSNRKSSDALEIDSNKSKTLFQKLYLRKSVGMEDFTEEYFKSAIELVSVNQYSIT